VLSALQGSQLQSRLFFHRPIHYSAIDVFVKDEQLTNKQQCKEYLALEK
jgi:hypothetical protein